MKNRWPFYLGCIIWLVYILVNIPKDPMRFHLAYILPYQTVGERMEEINEMARMRAKIIILERENFELKRQVRGYGLHDKKEPDNEQK